MSTDQTERAGADLAPAVPAGPRVLPEPDPMVYRMSGAEIETCAKFYHRKPRQIRRWVSIGSQKGYPCPLFKPSQMPAWWSRCMSHTVPSDILVLAIGVNGNCPPAGDATLPGPPDEPVDLKMIGLDECDSIKQMRGLAQAVYQQLADAYRKRSSDIPLLQRRYEQALNALRKEEAAERDALKDAGRLVPLTEIQRDMATLCEILRGTRENMARRVVELCPELPPDVRSTVVAAIERVRKREDQIFQRIDRFATPDELLRELSGA